MIDMVTQVTNEENVSNITLFVTKVKAIARLPTDPRIIVAPYRIIRQRVEVLSSLG